MTNSLKYNDKEKTRIIVNISETKDSVVLSFQDNGPGVSDEYKEKIFEIFQTTSNVDKNGTKATGIGLATVKSLIEGLNGEIKVISEQGKGLKTVILLKKL